MADGDQPTPGRILLKLSGEVLSGGSGHGIDPATLDELAGNLLKALSQGYQLGIVTGGGNFVRGRDIPSVGRVTGDQMGMLATVINALALKDSLEKHGGSAAVLSAFPVPGITETFSPHRAVELLQNGSVNIYSGGTGNPGLTTDTAAALRALQTGCSMLLKGTKVDGVFSGDPETDPDATRFGKISYDEVLRRDLGFMDAAAVAVCREADLVIRVFDVRDPGNIIRVLGDPSFGSTVGGSIDD